MTLLQKMHQARQSEREALRLSMQHSLRQALQEIYPRGTRVWIFGSVIQPGRFDEYSDIDIAVETPPEGRSLFWLQGELEARIGSAVDVLLLTETKLRPKIERQGQMWIL